jgi:hypothetical protein
VLGRPGVQGLGDELPLGQRDLPVPRRTYASPCAGSVRSASPG